MDLLVLETNTHVLEIIYTPCKKHQFLVFDLLNTKFCKWLNEWYFFVEFTVNLICLISA